MNFTRMIMQNNPLNDVKKTEVHSLHRWTVVIASFFVTVMVYGGSYSFGVFFKPLREDFGWTTAATSGAFSLLMFSYCALGIVSGLAVDRFGPRTTVGIGGLLMGLGFLLNSRISTLWQIYMTHGILLGPGMSTAYTPLLTTISRRFTRWRGLALGIVTAGGGVGTFIIPPFVSYLISNHGWRLSYLILGPLVGGTLIGAAFFLKKDRSQIRGVVDKKTGATKMKGNGVTSDATDFSLRRAFGTKNFWFLCLMNLTVGFGVQMMIVHIVPYAQQGLRLSPMIAATVLGTIGAGGIVGRLTMGAASDRIGPGRALAVATSIEGAMIIGIMSSSRAWMLHLFAAIFGFGYGGHVPQFPGLAGKLFGLRRMGTILGTQAILYGVGGAFGPFLAGHIFDRTGSYANAFVLAATGMFLTAASTLFIKRPKF
ncbi:MFS transporter [Thermodesulfobacteriota bacterium]